MKTDGITEGLAKAAAQNHKPKEGDYIKDGLLYCGKCHTPKRCEVEFGGRIIKPRKTARDSRQPSTRRKRSSWRTSITSTSRNRDAII